MRTYFYNTFWMAFLATPLLYSLPVFFLMSEPIVGLWVSPILICLLWLAYLNNVQMPEDAWRRYLPVALPFFYFMITWLVGFGMSGYSYSGSSVELAMMMAPPFWPMSLVLSFNGDVHLYPRFVMLLYAVIIITMMGKARRLGLPVKNTGKSKGLAALILCLCLVFLFQNVENRKIYLSEDWKTPRIEDEVDTYDYRPFGQDSLLARMNEQPELSISSDYPRLDGATAAYPVYAAMTQFIYQGLNESTADQYVSCTATGEAYQRLIQGEVDIFFGAQPSKQQIEMAQQAGVKLMLTPIGREAFVFFVNKDNPVEDLTVEQIRKIYRKEIANWKELGGADEKITPFQRPENSGSQTVMLAKVMEGQPLPAPLKEEFAAGMGGVISQVATYRNYSSAIGYSFRYYATGMKPNDDIRLLSVEGVEPTVENIQSNTYPFTVEVYAVTTANTGENSHKVIQWLLSEQGQRFISLSGYVPL